jgi:hypothetical protein
LKIFFVAVSCELVDIFGFSAACQARHTHDGRVYLWNTQVTPLILGILGSFGNDE